MKQSPHQGNRFDIKISLLIHSRKGRCCFGSELCCLFTVNCKNSAIISNSIPFTTSTKGKKSHRQLDTFLPPDLKCSFRFWGQTGHSAFFGGWHDPKCLSPCICQGSGRVCGRVASRKQRTWLEPEPLGSVSQHNATTESVFTCILCAIMRRNFDFSSNLLSCVTILRVCIRPSRTT